MGVRILFFSQNFYYFFLGAHAKFQNPTTIPSGRLSNELERKKEREKEEKKMPFIVANYVYASSQGQRTHSAGTKKHNLDGLTEAPITSVKSISLIDLSKLKCLQ